MVNVECRNCDFKGRVKLRKSETKMKVIPHKRTGEPVKVFSNVKTKNQKAAAVTGVKCPKCKQHKLKRAGSVV